ncbi:hypothetical protein EYF80_009381 [Liparis tanakae]|uniref:Uncharacterized protein n=1 Tax=Liparis tanakae TaxID=230148 RepID=A0A4Z2IRH5_9TELE|nr:hypothetical protein EYF80_009381 [Liparis tanakae]
MPWTRHEPLKLMNPPEKEHRREMTAGPPDTSYLRDGDREVEQITFKNPVYRLPKQQQEPGDDEEFLHGVVLQSSAISRRYDELWPTIPPEAFTIKLWQPVDSHVPDAPALRTHLLFLTSGHRDARKSRNREHDKHHGQVSSHTITPMSLTEQL